MNIEKIAELFCEIGFKVNPAGLKLFEKRLKEVEKQLKSISGTQEKAAKTATKATKSQADATEKAAKSTKKQAKEVKSLDKAYSDMYRNQKKNLKSVVAELGGKGGVSPMTQWMRQMQAMQRTATGANSNAWAKNFQKSVAGLTGTSGGSRGGQAFYDKLFGAVPQIQAKAKNANAWAKNFQASLGSLGPQSQSEMSKYYADLEKKQEQAHKKQVQYEEKVDRVRGQLKRAQERADDQLRRKIERFDAAQLKAQERIASVRQRQQGLFQGNPNQYAGGLAGALVSTAAGGMGLSYLNQANQDIVSKRIAVQASAGGGEKGIQAWSWLKTEGQRLAFDYRDMAQEYTNLIASFQAGGQTNEVAQQVFRGIMEKSTMLKIAPERRKLIMRAVGQISNKDQLYSEELVGQLSESLPGAIGAMTEAFRLQRGISSDVPIKEVGRMMREAMGKGEVKGDILPYFAKVLAARTPEQLAALEKALESSVAAQNRFKNSWSGILEIMSDVGMEKAFFELWTTFGNEMERSAESSKSFAQILQYLFALLEAFAKVTGDIATIWLPKMSASLDIGQDKIMAFMLIVGSLFVPIARWVTILGFLVLAIEDVSKGLQGMNSWTKQIFEYFGGGDFQTGAQRILGVTAALLSMALAVKAVRAAGKIGDLLGGKNGQTLGDKILGRVGATPVYVVNWPGNGINLPTGGGTNGQKGGGMGSSKLGLLGWLGMMAGATIGSVQSDYTSIPAIGEDTISGRLEALLNIFPDVKFTDYRDMYSAPEVTSKLNVSPYQAAPITFGDIKVQVDVANLDPNTDLNVTAQGLADALREQMKSVTRDFFTSELNTAGMNYSSSNME